MTIHYVEGKDYATGKPVAFTRVEFDDHSKVTLPGKLEKPVAVERAINARRKS
jgi:hypothetical protein